MRAHRKSLASKSRNGGRFSTLLRGLEQLESRNLLTVSVSNVHLTTDTGSSSTDKITYTPTLAGDATGSPPPGGSAQVQFDHNNDGVANGSSNISGGGFTYDPIANDSALASWEGSLTIRYRTRELDAYGSQVSVGDWQNFNMTLDRVAPTTSGLSSITVPEHTPNNSQANLHNAFADGVTADSSLAYQVVSNSNAGLFDSVSISSGTLTLDYKQNGYGSANIVVRATDQAGNTRDTTQQVTVYHVNLAPVIHDFQCALVSGNQYLFTGWVEDDGDMCGLIVAIYLPESDQYVEAAIQGDGSFSRGLTITDPNVLYALAWTYDGEEEPSEEVDCLV
jgi:hypothetical protein